MVAEAANSGKYLRPWRVHSNSHQECFIVLEQQGRPRICVVKQGPSRLYPNRAKLSCKLRAGVEVIHCLFSIASRQAKNQMFKPNPEKSLGQVLRRGQTDNRQFQ